MEASEYDRQAAEAAARALWESRDAYRYDRGGTGPVFGGPSLHGTRWPAADPAWGSDAAARSAVDQLAVILNATRVRRSSPRPGNSARLRSLTVQAHTAPAADLLDAIAV